MTLILQGTDNSVSSPAVQGGTAGATTGVYYPTTNQVALATNGSLALLVNSSQQVGIGTSSPANPLDVQTATGDCQVRSKSNGGGGGGRFVADGNGSGSYPGITFAQSGTNYWTVGQRADTNLYLFRESGSGSVFVNSGTGELVAQNTVKVWVSMATSGTAYNSFGLSSTSKVSTGVYQLNFSRTLSSSRFGMGAGVYAGNLIANMGAESTTGVRIYVWAPATGVASDSDCMAMIAGGS